MSGSSPSEAAALSATVLRGELVARDFGDFLLTGFLQVNGGSPGRNARCGETNAGEPRERPRFTVERQQADLLTSPHQADRAYRAHPPYQARPAHPAYLAYQALQGQA